MKKLTCIVFVFVAFFSGVTLIAQTSQTKSKDIPGKFVTCSNPRGGGFFWVDTTSSKIWRVVYSKNGFVWKYIGQPQSKMGANGTYIPYPNKDGSGLFILNTITGEGWYVTGREWSRDKKYKSLGKPKAKID